MIGSPRVTFTPATASHFLSSLLYTKPFTFSGICPWSWYITTTMSYQPPSALLNTVSGGVGAFSGMLIPSASASSMAGWISSISSLPNIPFSPQCGFRPATPIFGSLIPSALQPSFAMRITSRTLSFLQRSHAWRRDTCVLTWMTRNSSCASIMEYFAVCV